MILKEEADKNLKKVDKLRMMEEMMRKKIVIKKQSHEQRILKRFHENQDLIQANNMKFHEFTNSSPVRMDSVSGGGIISMGNSMMTS